ERQRRRTSRLGDEILLPRLFFFQAEDGIRDRTVTGVQTCALPIFPKLERLGKTRAASSASTNFKKLNSSSSRIRRKATRNTKRRSEERRVGKECRSRWWRYYSKNKAALIDGSRPTTMR